MTSISNILLDKEILLESGTNELELLVFNVADYTFGINVAKVREILPALGITKLPRAHRSVRGVFKLRDRVIPCVSLLDYLGIESTREPSESTLVLTDLNQQQTAFLVDGVERIHRIGWENILAVPGMMALAKTPVTALARCDQRLVVMLDFEMIIDQVSGQFFRTDVVENPLEVPRETLRILLADDSPSVREAISSTLRNSGYTQLEIFQNGAEAWDWIEKRLAETGSVEGVGDLLISDVEMPQIDGLHLTSRIKKHPELRRLPVLLYSSIITSDNHKKGAAVGADAQVSKPELNRVVELADELILAAQRKNDSGQDPGPEVTAPSTDAEEPTDAPAAPEADLAAETSAAPAKSSPKPSPSSKPKLAKTKKAASAKGTPAKKSAKRTGTAKVNAKLWRTFRDELADRAAHLNDLIAAAKQGGPDEDTLNEVFRTLHTVKSAAMVVPVDEVTRATHLVESLVESARHEPGKWPQESLKRYVDWLDSFASSGEDPSAVLQNSPALEAELTDALAAAAP